MSLEEFAALNGAQISTDNFVLVNRWNYIEDAEVPVDFSFIVYSSRGKSSVSVDGKRYLISGPTVAVVHPGQRVCVHSVSEDYSGRMLCMGGEIGMELSISDVFLTMFVFEDSPIVKITKSFSEACELFFEAFERVNRFDDNPYKRDCLVNLLRSFFYSAGYYLMRSLKFRGASSLYNLSSRFSSRAEGNIKDFISLVEGNAQTQRRLSFYAEKMGYNPKYLTSMIKKETGYSAQELIDRYATLKAMAKLAYGTKNIKEISVEMEFSSQSDFGKYFKRNTGKSPLEYRKIRERLAAKRVCSG